MEFKDYAYLRVSGRGQIEGDGLTRQLSAIKKYAAANNIKIVRVFREEGVSGTADWKKGGARSTGNRLAGCLVYAPTNTKYLCSRMGRYSEFRQ